MIHTESYWSDASNLSRFIGTQLNLRKTLSWECGPIFYNEENQEQILSKILSAINKIAEDNNITIIRGSSPPLANKNFSELYAKNGYKLIPWSTYITYLDQDIDKLYNSFDKKIRYDIRKSEKTLEFEVANKREALDEYQELKISTR